MKSLDNYQTWNQAFYHLGAKGSPENPLFDFSKEEFFVRGTIFAENDPRTTSAFSYWVSLFGKDLNHKQIKQALLKFPFDPAWLGYYLDIINQDSFKDLYSFTKSNNQVRILFKVKQPDLLLLKWGIHSKPMSESADKYLHLDKSKNRVF